MKDIGEIPTMITELKNQISLEVNGKGRGSASR